MDRSNRPDEAAPRPTRLDKLMYPVSDAAELLHRRRSWMYSQIERGEIQAVVVGSQKMILATELESYVDRQTSPADERVGRLLPLVDDDGRIDVATIPRDATIADLRALRQRVAGQEVTP